MNKAFISRLDSFMADRENLPVGGNALSVYLNGEEIYRKYTGFASGDTLWRVYSMTKPVTVTAALQLMEEGRFSLSDPLYAYLPEFEHMSVWSSDTQTTAPAKNAITILDLFRMTAGFTYDGEWGDVPRFVTRARAALEKEHPGESYTTRQFVKALAGVPLAFEPGTHWNYSLCHDVLGALIEAVSGRTLGEYMKERIFEPLGMKHTFFRCPDELRPFIAPHDATPEQDAKYSLSARYESGGGGLLSTLDDYMTFALTLTNGGLSPSGYRILQPDTVNRMRTDRLTPVQKKDFNWDYLHGYSYGLGVRTMIDPAASGIPGNAGEFGWCGVLGTWVLMDPAEKLTAVYMHQRYPNLEKYVQLSLRPLIYGLIRS
ncbi:MAG: beta-lactamase family protein [Clostridia bacterium]|nr:beta-lactamase family protein [Clostridia bacterium]